VAGSLSRSTAKSVEYIVVYANLMGQVISAPSRRRSFSPFKTFHGHAGVPGHGSWQPWSKSSLECNGRVGRGSRGP